MVHIKEVIMKRVVIRITEEEHRDIKVLAARLGQTMAELISFILRAHLANVEVRDGKKM
jgi:predicted DNA-binding protein